MKWKFSCSSHSKYNKYNKRLCDEVHRTWARSWGKELGQDLVHAAATYSWRIQLVHTAGTYSWRIQLAHTAGSHSCRIELDQRADSKSWSRHRARMHSNISRKLDTLEGKGWFHLTSALLCCSSENIPPTHRASTSTTAAPHD